MPNPQITQSQPGDSQPIPSIGIYDRLEVRPRSAQFERSLRAEVRDALWMLTRQWQFGEFKGEDAGSPVFARINYSSGKIKKFKPGNGDDFVDYDPDFPLEAVVEAQEIPMDVATRIQVGNFWSKLLLKNGIDEDIRSFYLAAYEIEDLDPSLTKMANPLYRSYMEANPELYNLLKASVGRVCDGKKLLDTFRTTPASNGSGANGATIISLDNLGLQLVTWFDSLYKQPTSEDSSWDRERLEYRFSIQTEETNTSNIAMNAAEYYQGRLDWHAFDREEETVTGSNSVMLEEKTVIMSEARFPGMPHPRYWKFEDAYVNLENFTARKTDLTKALLNEFALVYGNDWSVVPFKIPVATHTYIRKVTVKDVFGHIYEVGPSGSGQDDQWQKWRMYNLKTEGDDPYQRSDTGLFLPPVLPEIMEGDPIEKVAFIRDEMANMVWAIEQRIPNQLGGSENGSEAAVRLSDRLNVNRPGTASTNDVPKRRPEEGALIEYSLMNTVPENWIPLIPVNLSGDINVPDMRLQRGAMPRIIDGLAPTPVRPRSFLMNDTPIDGNGQPLPMYIHEEEVPRSGIVVSASFQRTRWHDGSVVVWVGRRKEVGRGEGSSNLKFDYLKHK